MYPTVHSLRKAGHKVRVTHLRFATLNYYKMIRHVQEEVIGRTDALRDMDATFEPRGGVTCVDVMLSDGRLGCGYAAFDSDENYNRKKGVAAALSDALHQLNYRESFMVIETNVFYMEVQF